MINLEWLRTFKTIYEKGSMTAAAKALFISQPGVSLHLSSLENHVGYQLFERRPRKLIPTEHGKLLYNAIVDPINHLQKTEKNFQRGAQKEIPSVTVGMCFEAFQMSLERHVSQLPFNLILEFCDYPELLQKLEKNVVDIVVTPQKFEAKNISYRPFSKANIILVAGRGTDTHDFEAILKRNNPQEILQWLKGPKWYGITGDNEYLRRFWQLNFNTHPDFRPNYIVPNIRSIVRSLSSAPGLAVIPDFLCHSEIQSGALQILWRGFTPLSSTLYFARRKKTLYPDQITRIEEILEKEIPRPLPEGGSDLHI